MKMEELTKMLRASGDIEKCCLAAVIEHECRRFKTDPAEENGKTVIYLYGLLEAMTAFGGITEDEKRELLSDIDKAAYGEADL